MRLSGPAQRVHDSLNALVRRFVSIDIEFRNPFCDFAICEVHGSDAVASVTGTATPTKADPFEYVRVVDVSDFPSVQRRTQQSTNLVLRHSLLHLAERSVGIA